MPKLIDITYQTFGMLTAIEIVGTRTNGTMWRCICNCGKETVVQSRNLRKGLTKSCGCLRKKHAATMARGRAAKHNKSKSRIYAVWCGMKRACYLPTRQNYINVGGRGITVCDEWKDDFQAFYDWAMANGYDENAPRGQSVIYRVDKNKDFSPENCRIGSFAESRKRGEIDA